MLNMTEQHEKFHDPSALFIVFHGILLPCSGLCVLFDYFIGNMVA